eukprot:3916714-Alexandrium_andersonii.AAC.1
MGPVSHYDHDTTSKIPAVPEDHCLTEDANERQTTDTAGTRGQLAPRGKQRACMKDWQTGTRTSTS